MTQGPGSYNVTKLFGSDSKNMSIGVRRSYNQDVNPGHTPLDDDKNTRARSPEHNFVNKTGRLTTITETTRLGPGSYSVTTMPYDAKNMTIGERRYEQMEVTPGPGHYHDETAQNVVRPVSAINEFSKSYSVVQLTPSPSKRVSFVQAPNKGVPQGMIPNKSYNNLSFTHTRRQSGVSTSKNSQKQSISSFQQSSPMSYSLSTKKKSTTKKKTQQDESKPTSFVPSGYERPDSYLISRKVVSAYRGSTSPLKKRR